MSEKINVAVLGYGHLGKWHTQKAHQLEQANLVAIVEPFEQGKKAAQEAYPGVKVVDDIKDIIDEIDAAVIVTPTSTHFELSSYLLSKGKHVFCEKPLCSTYDEAKKISDHISSDQVLQVGHSERCHEAWELLQGDFSQLTGPLSVKLTRAAAFKGRATDVDVVQDLMIHDLDLCHYLFGKKMKSVKAYGHKIRTEKWDHVTCVIEAEDGSFFEITSGRNHVREIRELEVMSSSGCISVDLFKNEIHRAHNKESESGEYVQTSPYNKRDHLLMEQENFYNSILGKEKPLVSYSDGAFIVSLIGKVLESLETGETVVLN